MIFEASIEYDLSVGFDDKIARNGRKWRGVRRDDTKQLGWV